MLPVPAPGLNHKDQELAREKDHYSREDKPSDFLRLCVWGGGVKIWGAPSTATKHYCTGNCTEIFTAALKTSKNQRGAFCVLWIVRKRRLSTSIVLKQSRCIIERVANCTDYLQSLWPRGTEWFWVQLKDARWLSAPGRRHPCRTETGQGHWYSSGPEWETQTLKARQK